MQDSLTLIRSASEIDISDPPPNANPAVIGMNFGRTTLGDIARLYWFGLPYGIAYEDIWYVVGRDLLGVILLYTDKSAHDEAAMFNALQNFAPRRILTVHLPHIPPTHQPALEIEALDATALWACVRQLLRIAPPDGYTDMMLAALEQGQ